MNTLHLSLKKKWYELIEKGMKSEEYREIKDNSRLIENKKDETNDGGRT